MGDNLARERVQPRSTLAVPAAARRPQPEAAETPGVELATGGDSDPLPDADSPYVAYGRPSNKPEITLHVMLRDGYWRGFAWSNYDSVEMVAPERAGAGPVLVLRFAGLMPAELWISGCNLRKLHVLLGQNRIAWMREVPSKRGFDGAAANRDTAEVITRIIPRPWKPDRGANPSE